mgnify:CR=1 FL=1
MNGAWRCVDRCLATRKIDKATANVDDFNRDFQRLVTEMLLGRGLDAVGPYQQAAKPEQSLHDRGTEPFRGIQAARARRAPQRLHAGRGSRHADPVAIYAGIPAGVEAFRIARKVLMEEG